MNKSRALVFGYFVKNVGDDLMLKEFVRRYSYKYRTIFILSEKKYKFFYKDMGLCVICRDNIIFKVVNKILGYLKKAELYYYISFINNIDFVLLGGSIFAESSTDYSKIQQKNLEYATKHSRATYVVGSNFGPFESKNFYQYYKMYFCQCKDVCFRDKYSYKLFKELPMVRYAPDVVFAGQWKSDSSNKETIVVSLIDIKNRAKLSKYGDAYEIFIKDLCIGYLKKGEKILLISMCDAEGDLKICQKIYNHLTEQYHNAVSIIQYDNLDNIISVFSSAKKIIATRFHAMILGIYFKKNILCISYDLKTKRAIESYDIDCDFLSIEDIIKTDAVNFINFRRCYYSDTIKSEAQKQFLAIE